MSATPQTCFHLTLEIVREIHAEAIWRVGWVEVVGGVPVPAVLMSGNHAALERWRRDQSLTTTHRLRPELVVQARVAGRLSSRDEECLAGRQGD